MSLLVAVKSCREHLDLGYHDIIRATWGRALRGKAHVRFFIGHTDTDYFMAHPKAKSRLLQNDEVEVDTLDDYNSLPFKTRAICRWVLAKNIDNTFLCDTDTYVNAKKLLTCGYERYDYVGKISRPLGETFPYKAVDRAGNSTMIENCYPWASGGYGYFLSRDAAFLISDTYPSHWAEDLWVGQILGKEIQNGNMLSLDLPAGSYSEHFPSALYGSGYDPKFSWMEMKYAENK